MKEKYGTTLFIYPIKKNWLYKERNKTRTVIERFDGSEAHVIAHQFNGPIWSGSKSSAIFRDAKVLSAILKSVFLLANN